MAVITNAPALIDTVGTESAQGKFQEPLFQGPFKVGKAIYVFIRSRQTPITLNAFKSTNGGATWVQMDTANSPVLSGSLTRIGAVLNQDGRTITIAYTPQPLGTKPSVISFCTFNAPGSPDAFVKGVIPDITSTLDGTGLGAESFAITDRVNGDLVCFYTQTVAPNAIEGSIGYRVLSGGVWSAFTVISAGDDATNINKSVPGCLLDPSTGIIHISFRQDQLIVTNSFETDFYGQLDAANVYSGEQQLTTHGANQRVNYGRMQFWNSSIVLPIYVIPSNGGTYIASIYIGTPVAVPVFSSTILESGGAAVSVFDTAGHQIIVEGTKLSAVWIHYPDQTTIELHVSDNTGGGFTPIDVFYDLVANPPNGTDISLQNLIAVNLGVIGSFGGMILVDDATDTVNVSYFLFSGTVPPGAVIAPFLNINIFPFPAGPDCCCPEDVACVHRSEDGEYYAKSKGIQKFV